MVQYWRFTRTSTARTLYDVFKRVGLTATRMYEYEASITELDSETLSPVPSGVRLERVAPGDVHSLAGDIDFSRPVEPHEREWVVVAYVGDMPVGRALVGDEEAPYVEPLERSITVSGAYVRRVFVHPDHRGAGVASRTVLDAMAVARDELTCDTATALVAVDNEPSRRLFEGRGFRRVRTHDYLRVGALSTYHVRE